MPMARPSVMYRPISSKTLEGLLTSYPFLAVSMVSSTMSCTAPVARALFSSTPFAPPFTTFSPISLPSFSASSFAPENVKTSATLMRWGLKSGLNLKAMFLCWKFPLSLNGEKMSRMPSQMFFPSSSSAPLMPSPSPPSPLHAQPMRSMAVWMSTLHRVVKASPMGSALWLMALQISVTTATRAASMSGAALMMAVHSGSANSASVPKSAPAPAR